MNFRISYLFSLPYVKVTGLEKRLIVQLDPIIDLKK